MATKEQEKPRSSRGRARRKSEQPQSKGSKSSNPVIRYFQETADELRKVSWPEQDEAIRLAMIVLVTMFISIVFLGGFDFIFQRLLRPLLSLGA